MERQESHIDPSLILAAGLKRKRREPTRYVDENHLSMLLADVPVNEVDAALHDEDFSGDEEEDADEEDNGEEDPDAEDLEFIDPDEDMASDEDPDYTDDDDEEEEEEDDDDDDDDDEDEDDDDDDEEPPSVARNRSLARGDAPNARRPTGLVGKAVRGDLRTDVHVS